MKRTSLLVGLLCVTSLLAGARADAAGPYTVDVGLESSADAQTLMYLSGGPVAQDAGVSCAGPDLYTSPANGVYWRVIDARAFAGKTVRVTWTAERIENPVELQPRAAFVMAAFSSRCEMVPAPGHSGYFEFPWSPKSKVVALGTGTRWLTVVGMWWKDLSLTITVVP